jgi:hypothetical protein
MEDDHRVWPPGPRHRREHLPVSEEEPDRPPKGRRGDPYGPEPPWNPRIHRTAPLAPPKAESPSWDTLPPSARLYGTPAGPGPRRRLLAGGLAALAVAAGVVAGATVVVQRLSSPPPAANGQVSDAQAGVTVRLPPGWSAGTVPPVTGFTSVIRDGDGGLVMARRVPVPAGDAKKATGQAAELYSRLLLKGDKVTVVEDREIPQGHTRALRAEYKDVVNRPAFLRVMLLTRAGRSVLLVGLLQPEENSRRQSLDAVMTSFR